MSCCRVSEIMSWYPAMTPMQKHNLLRFINYGRIGGTGKFVMLPVDQGFEHGPGRSFQPNPAGYDPVYHAKLAIDSGCNGYAAPLGQVEAASDIIAEADLPTILKVNSHDLMMPDDDDPNPAITSWVDDAVRLNCAAVGFTIYPGSLHSKDMYEQVRELAQDARAAGLVVVVWAYPRGSGLKAKEGLKSKDIETAVDVVCYAVHIAAQLGAHIIKCKPTSALVGLADHVKRGTYKDAPIDTLADRTKIVVKSAFDGKRIVINSGGEAKEDQEVLDEIKQLAEGTSFGSIVGRNAFQRSKDEAISLLHQIQDLYTK
ncbi:MAG: class I fructose-bisphosphate aldolase [Candidatus Poribacteria bacterium]